MFNHHPLVIRSCFLSVYPEACWIKALEEIIINNNQTEPIKTDYLPHDVGCYTQLCSYTHTEPVYRAVLICEYLCTAFSTVHTHTYMSDIHISWGNLIEIMLSLAPFPNLNHKKWIPNTYPKPNYNPTATLSLKAHFESQKCLKTCGDFAPQRYVLTLKHTFSTEKSWFSIISSEIWAAGMHFCVITR